MKNLFLLTISFIAILFTGITTAQPSKALPGINTDLNRLRQDMYADKNDSWNVLSFKNGFYLWIKQHYTSTRPKSAGNFGYYGNATLAQLNATSEIELAASFITPQNADKYLYHVIVNDSVELVHWMKPSIFRSNKYTTYAYLGKFNCLGKIIKVEIYEINNYKNKSVLIFNSGYMPAPKINFVALMYNNKYLFNPNKQEYIPNSKQRHFSNQDWHQAPISFKWSAEINYLAVELNNTLQNDMYHVYLKRMVEGKTDVVLIGNSWEQSYYSPNPQARINSSYFNRSGMYEIIVKPEMPEEFKLENSDKTVSIPFTVLPGPISLPMKTLAFIILILLTTGGFIFMMYRQKQKRKLFAEAQNRQVATLQLQSVRSQLNPHFMFNALAGIQNLMNKNEIDLANKYLARFARLTRNVLDDGNKELTTIEHETDLLNDYLQMEQMRFGFEFTIDVVDIDQQIEIPAMLLQPFAENAVKHGVSALKEKGLIKVAIIKNDADLIMTISDNGQGFSNDKAAGLGTRLCKERIALLNGIYKNTTILLHINTGDTGTIVSIELKNWL